MSVEELDTGAAPATEAEPTEAAAEPLPETAEAAQKEEDDAWDAIESKASGEPVSEEEPGEPAEEAGETGDGEAAETEEGDKKPDATAAETKEDDVWAEAPDELRSAYAAEKARADAAEHGKKSAEGRSNALTRRLDAMMAGSEEVTDPATRKPKTEDDTTSEADPEWDAFVSDYPEIAGPVSKLLDGQKAKIASLEEQNKTLAAGLQTVGEDRLTASSVAEEAIVLENHPDYSEIARTDEFVAWAESQPGFILDGIKANAEFIVDGQAVTRILKMYKDEKGIAEVKGNGAAAGRKSGKPKPAADPLRSIQRRSATGLPASSAGATVPESSHADIETEDAVWDKIERDEKSKQEAREAARV